MRGSIRKRCQCRDDHGRLITGCRKAHGSWSFKIEVGIDPDTGKRKQVGRSGFRTSDEAHEAMTKELAALNAGAWSDDKSMTVGEWLDQWLGELRERGRAAKTMANYDGHVRDAWKPHLGRIRLRDLRRRHVERVLTKLSSPLQKTSRPSGNVGRRVTRRSASTVESYRRTLRAALSVAQRRDLIQVNPAQGPMDVIADRRVVREMTVWEPEETARFLRRVENDRLSALYEVAAYAGLRRGELCGLRWSDLDDDGTGLRIRQAIVEVSRSQLQPEQRLCPICSTEHVGRLFKEPKSAAGRRWVPLATPAMDALTAHRVAQAAERAEFGPDYCDHDLVFASIDGTPLRPGAVTRAFEAHVKACGLPVVRLHDTRHGACSLMLSGGVPMEVVQMILGHSTSDVTRIYAHVMRKASAEQVNTATEPLTRLRREQSANNTPP